MANIVPIPKPNKDTDKGTSYRPISLLSVIAKTLETSLLPYITANIPNTPMQHGYKTQHYTVKALHTLNNTVAKGFNQMTPPARTITVALDMSKAFDTINIDTPIRKLLQTNIPDTIIKFIANYIKGCKAYTTYINHTSIQRQFKTGVPQGGVLSPTLFNIYTSDFPPPSAPVLVIAYADNITITSTHTSTSVAKKYIQPYLHKVFAWTKQNNLLLNQEKTVCTLFTPDHAEYTSNLDLTINNKALPMATHPKVLGLTLDPKLTYSTQIHNISVQAHKPLQIIKVLTATGWGKQKETLMATYKAVMRPALEYASSVWSPIASSTSINKLQVMQNATYRNNTSKQRQFKTGVPQGGVLSPTLFNIYTSYLPPLSALVQVMAYADDITITSTHTSTSAAKKYIQPYLHKVFACTKQNNLILIPDKTTCTLFTPDLAEYTSNLDLKYITMHYPWQRTQRFWVLPQPQNSHTAHTSTTNLYKS